LGRRLSMTKPVNGSDPLDDDVTIEVEVEE
jgi:hypothetical protein